ncbi:MAG: iron ABC transporter permease [Kordiimonadaceae bacterium]|nr:iron ABC transporter permease [Kordiimonadaceae bacterium]MBO6567582.1 iron ABC transporter permease [Kordiimonadaceae bacterium]MBO6963204.1 iron ABC transporter permease [Kordiimonadaceae bacterium]
MQQQSARSAIGATTAIVLLLLVASLLAGLFGQTTLSPKEFVQGLLGASDTATNIIVQDLRLPRLLLGALCGATLGYAGALLQGLLRNPLADPGVVGVSASASLGAVIVIYLGAGAVGSFAVPLGAIAGALIATGILLAVSLRDASVLTLILTGVGISSLAAAGISLVMNFAPHPMTLQEMILWMMGSLENRSFHDLVLAAPFMAVGILLVAGAGQGLNALSLGEDTARTLGVNIKSLRTRIVIGVSLAVGATVAVAGAIGFVGLVVPHLARTLFGFEPKRILLPSALLGALILLLADILTRLPIGYGQLRLGVVMGVIGAPVFLYIIFKTRETMR